MANDGGSAFPVTNDALADGMSLRDWFAGQALGAMLTRADLDPKHDSVLENLSASSYRMADALLAERSKTEPRK